VRFQWLSFAVSDPVRFENEANSCATVIVRCALLFTKDYGRGANITELRLLLRAFSARRLFCCLS